MKTMTTREIQERLSEIARLEAEHATRDFDGELRSALESGANIDALEEAQLQAERVARRLRVERQALEAALPAAQRREAEQAIDRLVKSCDSHMGRFKKTADALADLLEKANTLRKEMEDIGRERAHAYTRADQLARAHGLDAQVLKPFRRLTSGRLDALNRPTNATVERGGISVSWDYIQSSIDVDQPATDAA